MQMLALLSGYPPQPGRNSQKPIAPYALATRFLSALAIIAAIVAAMEMTGRNPDQPESKIASFEQEF